MGDDPGGDGEPEGLRLAIHVAEQDPGLGLAVRASGSTRIPFIWLRSITIPESQTESPG